MSVAKKSFGTTKNGEEVTLYTIANKNNVSVSVIDYGANLVSLMVPDKNGNVEDIVLGFDTVAGYEVNGCFFGAFIGRHGNRIGDAKFELDGVTYELEKNDGKNNLHGGTFALEGDVSSQFVTGLLFALPLLKENSEIVLTSRRGRRKVRRRAAQGRNRSCY